MIRFSLCLATVLLISAIQANAETIAVRLKGLYPVTQSWIAYRSGDFLEIIPASVTVDNSVTVITAERHESVGRGEISAIALDTEGKVISSEFEDSGAIGFETQDRRDELLLLKSRAELLRKSRETLSAQIEIEREKLDNVGVVN